MDLLTVVILEVILLFRSYYLVATMMICADMQTKQEQYN